MENILIFGHKKPDTDSVTSAIALAYLKNQLGFNAKPYILSNINRETEYVLKFFGFDEPEFLNDTKLQIKDINYHKDYIVEENESILNTYKYMIDRNITGIPLVNKTKKFSGLITSTMICKEVIDGNNNYLEATLTNILNSLKAKAITKFDNIIKGKISYNLEDCNGKEDYILITNNLPNDLKHLKTIIIYDNSSINRDFIKNAKNEQINIIKTELNFNEIIKNIGLSKSIKEIVSDERFEEIEEDDYYDEFLSKSTNLGYNNYPVVNKSGECCGLLRITDINQVARKKVILVDHNEMAQSALGLEEADILEIVDHHQLGDLRTNKPINFRNMTVGSTNTIIYSMFNENNIKIPKNLAGLMLAGIISDTLILTSPTTTEYDKNAVKNLAKIAKINYEKFGLEMFKNATLLGDKTKNDLINEDFKVYSINDKKFAISQVFTLNPEEILNKKKDYIKVLEKIKDQKDYSLVLLCLTDISTKGSYFLFTESDKSKVEEAFKINNIEQGFYAEKIVSRKQQIVPVITNALKNVNN